MVYDARFANLSNPLAERARLGAFASVSLSRRAAAAARMPCDPRSPPGGGGGLSARRFGTRELLRSGAARGFFAANSAAALFRAPLAFLGARRNPSVAPPPFSASFCSSPSSYDTACFPEAASNALTVP